MELSIQSTQLNVLNLVYGLVAFWLLKKAALTIYNAYSTPLARIPGPWYAPFTTLCLWYHTNLGQRMFYVDSLHHKYGGVVRIAPNEIDVSDRAAYKEMSRIGSGFTKSPFYHVMRTEMTDESDLFTLSNPKEHSRRRALFAPSFTRNFMVENWEQFVVDRVREAIAKVRREAEHGSSDIFKWLNLMTSEIIGKIAFGEDFGLIKSGKQDSEVLKSFNTATMVAVLRTEWGFLYRLLKSIDLPSLRSFFGAPARMYDFSRNAAFNARNGDLKKSNIFTSLISAQSENAALFSDDLITIEAEGFLFGGSTTIKTTCTYLFYEILRRPDWQQRLEEEVAKLPVGYSSADVEELPVLNSVVLETLRYHAAAPGALRRMPPAQGTELAGFFIPGGTTVAHQAYSLNRDSGLFPNPYSFEPGRFIEPEAATAGKAAIATFGAGTRVCIGKHLAYIELRHIVAEFFRECKGARLADGTTDKTMQPMEFLAMEPRGAKCEITLKGT